MASIFSLITPLNKITKIFSANLLMEINVIQRVHVYFLLLSAAVLAEWGAGHLVLVRDERLATHAGLLLHRKAHDSAHLGRRSGLADSAGVVPAQKGLRIGNDGLEDASQRVGQLVGQVILCINRQVVVQYPNRILALFISWSTYSKCNISSQTARKGYKECRKKE